MRLRHLALIASALVVSSVTAACNSSTGLSVTGAGLLDGRLFGTRGRPFGLGISPAGQALVLQLDNMTAARFAITADTITDTIRVGYNPIDVDFTATGNLAFMTMLNGARVYRIDLTSGAVSSVAVGARHHRISLLPNGGAYDLFNIDGKVRRVDATTGIAGDSVALGGASAPVLRGVARRSQDGRIAVAGGSWVWLLNGATLDVLDSLDLLTETQEVVFSKDGSELFVALEFASRVMVLDAASMTVTDSILFPNDPMSPFAMRLSPDGRTLLVSSAASGRVAVVDPASRAVRRVLVVGGIPRRIAYGPNGQRAFVTNEGGWVDVIK